MSWPESVLLGLLQGVTEFLPVSSSGHLVLAESILGVERSGVSFEVVVHLGTLTAVLAVFATPLLTLLRGLLSGEHESLRRLGMLALASVPAAAIGLLLKSSVERTFDSPVFASSMLLVTGFVLWSLRLARRRRPSGGWPGPAGSLLVGLAQALAILPGISRSGATITAGIHSGVARRDSAEFCFLLSIPAILGAAALDIHSISGLSGASPGVMITGFLSASVAGYVALRLLLGIVAKGRLDRFRWYCWAAGLTGLGSCLIRG